MNKFFGIISRKSSDQQKSPSQSQSRSATHSPSDSCSYNYDGISDTKSLSDDIETAVEALPVEPNRRATLSSKEETSKNNTVEKGPSSSMESESSLNSATEQSGNPHPAAGSANHFQTQEICQKTLPLKTD